MMLYDQYAIKQSNLIKVTSVFNIFDILAYREFNVSLL